MGTPKDASGDPPSATRAYETNILSSEKDPTPLHPRGRRFDVHAHLKTFNGCSAEAVPKLGPWCAEISNPQRNRTTRCKLPPESVESDDEKWCNNPKRDDRSGTMTKERLENC